MIQFITIDANPVPSGAEIAQFTADDGGVLRYAIFPKTNSHGTIILQTGWSEFIEKYFETVDDLRERGWSVAMMDWRGQGLSDRARDTERDWRGYFSRLHSDLHGFTQDIVAPRMPGPLHLMTHSMGGLPGLKILASGTDLYKSAVLCAPMTRLFPPVTSLGYRAGTELACLAGMANTGVNAGSDDSRQFAGNMFTTDERRHSRFRLLQEREPAACVNSPTYGWVRESILESNRLHKPDAFADLKTPTLIVSAGAERRIDGSDHQNIAALSPHISVERIDGALHEIMMERDELRDQFLTTADNFLRAHQ